MKCGDTWRFWKESKTAACHNWWHLEGFFWIRTQTSTWHLSIISWSFGGHATDWTFCSPTTTFWHQQSILLLLSSSPAVEHMMKLMSVFPEAFFWNRTWLQTIFQETESLKNGRQKSHDRALLTMDSRRTRDKSLQVLRCAFCIKYCFKGMDSYCFTFHTVCVSLFS